MTRRMPATTDRTSSTRSTTATSRWGGTKVTRTLRSSTRSHGGGGEVGNKEAEGRRENGLEQGRFPEVPVGHGSGGVVSLWVLEQGSHARWLVHRSKDQDGD